MQMVGAKNTNCMETLYREHYARMFLYARAALRSEVTAEDVVQEAFRIACAKPTQVFESKNPGGWLMNTLKYVIKNEERAQTKLQMMLQTIGQESADTRFDMDECGELRQMLSDADFKLLWSIVIEGYSYAEAAHRHGISLELCKKRMYRLRKALRKNKK